MKKIMFLLILIFISSFVLASDDSTYPIIGGVDQDFHQGLGYFNFELDPWTVDYYSEAIGSSMYAPLVQDLDNDGIKEIIILSDTGILRIFQNISIQPDISASYSIPDAGTSQFFSNPVIFDSNDDGDYEIFILGEEEYLFSYSPGNLSLLNDPSTDNSWRNKMLLYCDDEENICLSFSEIYQVASNGVIILRVYNNTGQATLTYGLTTYNAASYYCLSSIPNVVKGDSDFDGNPEYYISYFNTRDSGNSFGIMSVELNHSTFPTNPQITIDSTPGAIYSHSSSFATDPTGKTSCDTISPYPGTMVSPLLLFDFDLLHPGDEFLISGLTDDTEFKMYSVDYTGSVIDDYPEFGTGDGTILSNIMQINAFTDTGNVDACVIGYYPADSTFDILCASEQSDQFVEHKLFSYSYAGNLWDQPSDTKHINVLATASDMATYSYTGNNPNEIINSYGVWAFYQTSPGEYSMSDYDLIPLYLNAKGNSTIYPVDYNDDGRSELMIMTKNNLFFASDGFINSGCAAQGCITSYTVCPSLGSTWKINTSARVDLTIADIDDDDISGRVYLYYGDDNEMLSNWTAYYGSGTLISFPFDSANKTITSGTIRLQARDEENPTSYTTIDIPFSVALTGVEYGDGCTTTYPGFDAGEDGTNETTSDGTSIDDNAISETLDLITDYLGLGRTAIWLVIMILVAIIIITSLHKSAASGDFFMVLGVIGFVELLMLILGVYLTYLSAAIVIIIVIVVLGILGFILGKKITGSGG